MLQQSPDETGEPQPTEEDLAMAAAQAPSDAGRKLVLVAGSGRSGTSLMSGILKHTGMHVPQPEVTADATNPKGFGEPQWVVDFHVKLLNRVNVHASDARPTAWFDAGRASNREVNRAELVEWLGQQFEEAPSLVVKDPRTAWFLGMWRVAAGRCGATTATITMLRPPTEVVGSKNAYYGGGLDDITRLAGWTNMMLFTERATRDTPRSFVAYHDLLDDWTRTVVRVGEELQLQEVAHAGVRMMQEIHDFVDPKLHRVRATWDDLSVPAPLRELAQETWDQLSALTDPGADTPEVRRTLDQVRQAYGELYAEAEALAGSSIRAAVLEQQRAQPAAAAPAARPGAARETYRRARRLAGRVRRRAGGGAG
jgi:hypothetical protein